MNRVEELEAALNVALALLEKIPELMRSMATVSELPFMPAASLEQSKLIRTGIPSIEKIIAEARALVPRA